MTVTTLQAALGLKAEESPFPWQQRLLTAFQAGIPNRMSLDVPTGLGKTSAMAAWLVARACGADLPRRLVYIVDRRAVVDQATREAERLRTWVHDHQGVREQLGLTGDEQLAISTLRGQFADNREWLRSPARPAIIVGTVDMIGSRLLFEGYGVSRKMRPYHAGFLGSDSLFVLDEAHLVPPFEALLETIVSDQPDLTGDERAAKVCPRSVLLSLSATGRSLGGTTLRIESDDLEHSVAAKRLNAAKRLEFVPPSETESLPERLAREAWQLTDNGKTPSRVIVFCDIPKIAVRACDELRKSGNDAGIELLTQLFVGARRVRERQEVERWLEQHGFLAGTGVERSAPTFVFSTSAGEVGVDLDADHMVSDLVAFERMVQRFGRVNRRGNGEATIRVLLESEEPTKKEAQTLKKALVKSPRERNAGEHEAVRQFDLAPKYRSALQALPRITGESPAWDASPNAFRELKIRSNEETTIAEVLHHATTPPPLRPKLTRPILDAWSMTSLERHAGRTDVRPWLRGWVDDEPQTTVVWRKFLPTRSAGCSDDQIISYFEAAPIHLTERLETRSDEAFTQLIKRVEQLEKVRAKAEKQDHEVLESLPGDDDVVAIILTGAGDVVRTLTFSGLRFGNTKQQQSDKREVAWQLRNKTLILDARIGGLDRSGLFVPAPKDLAPTLAIDECDPQAWLERDVGQFSKAEPIPSFRTRLDSMMDDDVTNAATGPEAVLWKQCFRLPIEVQEHEEPKEALVVYRFRNAATSEASRSTIGPLSLDQHHLETEVEADRLAEELGLSDDIKLALRIAARNHDHGKNTARWQDAFSAPETGRPYAKTDGPFRNTILDGYRHEFGSLPSITCDPEFGTLTEELQELTLHLVAAHHGFGRPIIRTVGCDDAPPSALHERARDVALRFERMQKRWGPWGLAWLESLLRAADQRVSAVAEDRSVELKHTNTERESTHG